MNHKKSDAKIEVTKDGPYLVSGDLPLSEQRIVTNTKGESLDYREAKKYPAQKQYALCRCGQSRKEDLRMSRQKNISAICCKRQPFGDGANLRQRQMK